MIVSKFVDILEVTKLKKNRKKKSEEIQNVTATKEKKNERVEKNLKKN